MQLYHTVMDWMTAKIQKANGKAVKSILQDHGIEVCFVEAFIVRQKPTKPNKQPKWERSNIFSGGYGKRRDWKEWKDWVWWRNPKELYNDEEAAYHKFVDGLDKSEQDTEHRVKHKGRFIGKNVSVVFLPIEGEDKFLTVYVSSFEKNAKLDEACLEISKRIMKVVQKKD